MAEKEFKFDSNIVVSAEITLMAIKRIIPAINKAINGRTDLDLNEYAFVAANAIDAQLGHKSQIEEGMYLVAEAMAMAMAAQATKKGHLGALFETILRLNIRGQMSRFEHGEEDS